MRLESEEVLVMSEKATVEWASKATKESHAREQYLLPKLR